MKITKRVKSDFPIHERGLLNYMQENAEDGLFHQPQQMMADSLSVSRPFINKWAKVLLAHKRITLHEPAINGQAATYRIPCHLGDTPVIQVTPLSRVTGNTDSIDSVSVKNIYSTDSRESLGDRKKPTPCHTGDTPVTQVTPKKPLIIIAEPEPTRVVMIGDPDQKCLSLTNTRCKNQPLPNRQMCGPCEDEMVAQAAKWHALERKRKSELVTV